MNRFVCYGGKGGVGKTTCAAATGLGLARAGKRTLVISTDPAHSLADAFGVDDQLERQQIEEDLWIEQASPEAGERAYRGIIEELSSELRSAGISIDEEMIERLFTAGVVPGSDELAALELLAAHVDDDEFDHIVVDTAPTGHTLRLLDLPSVLQETVAAASTLRGQLRGMVNTARSAVLGPAAYLRGTGSDEEDEFSALEGRMEAVRTLFGDPDRLSFRIVCQPEPMVVAETDRLLDRLEEWGVSVDSLIVNRRLLDPDPECDRCTTRAREQRTQVDRLQELSDDLPVVELPDVGSTATHEPILERIADRLVTT
jgi:arsenite-transporting ATPase